MATPPFITGPANPGNYELTNWQFDANRHYLPTSAADVTQFQMWYIVSFLLGYVGGATHGLWTCAGSSDGTTGGMDGVFRWGTPGVYTPAKIVQITAGPTTTPHSWVVLKSPVMPNGAFTYILVEAYSSNTLGFSVYHSNIAWTAAGTPTFQPTNANWMPTTATAGAAQTNDGTTTEMSLHGCLAGNGNFVIFNARIGGGFPFFGMLWGNAYQAQNTDQFPYYFFRNYATSSPGAFSAVNIVSTGTASLDGGRNYNNSATGFNFNYFLNAGIFGSPKDCISEVLIDFPFWVFWTNGINALHARGRIQDIAYTMGISSRTPVGWPIRDSSGNIKYVLLGQLVVPFNAAPFF